MHGTTLNVENHSLPPHVLFYVHSQDTQTPSRKLEETFLEESKARGTSEEIGSGGSAEEMPQPSPAR